MFAGLFRTILYIVGVWVIWRWLDRALAVVVKPIQPSAPKRRRERHADDSNEGEYIDYEEVDD